jgi:ketosteroid isomerase-like protein
MPQENVALVKGIYQAFASGDVPAVLGAMSPDIVWNEAENFPLADRNPYVGPQAILEGVFARLGSDWEGFAVDPQEYLDAGGAVVVLGRYRGTCRATGKPVDAQLAHVWRIEDGKAKAFQQLTDTLQFAKATGTA